MLTCRHGAGPAGYMRRPCGRADRYNVAERAPGSLLANPVDTFLRWWYSIPPGIAHVISSSAAPSICVVPVRPRARMPARNAKAAATASRLWERSAST